MAAERSGPQTLVAAIIAGGRAVRFGGRVKALIEVEGRTILDRQRGVLASRVDEIVVSANDPAGFAGARLTVIPDDASGGGPMLGIAAVLAHTGAAWALVVASDMPYLDGGVLDLLLDGRSDDVDAVVPWIGSFPEPLLALYSARVLPVLRRHIAAERRSLSRLLGSDELRVARVPEERVRAIDPELRSLVNLNRPSDLAGLAPLTKA